MKKYLLIALFSLVGITAKSQNQGANLYLIFNVNEPDVIKNVYKYVGNQPNNPTMVQCGVFKIGTDLYCFSYPLFYGLDLDFTAKQGAPTQTMSRTQATALYPNAMNATQLDAFMQPYIETDYTTELTNSQTEEDSATIRYFRSFANIYVIEYLPNNQAKVVNVLISTAF